MMTSCSYYHASASSRRTVAIFHHRRRYLHQRLFKLNRQSSSLPPNFNFWPGKATGAASNRLLSSLTVHRAYESSDRKQERFNLKEGRDKNINKFIHFSMTDKSLLYSTDKIMFGISNRLFHSDIFRGINKNNLQLIDSTDLSTCSPPQAAVELCSSCVQCESLRTDLNIAPFGFRTLSNNKIPFIFKNLGESMSNISPVKVSPGRGKEGEGSWKSFCEVIRLTSDTDRKETIDSSGRDYESGDVENRSYRPYHCNDLGKKGYLGKRAMSLSLLLDPIVGSPPSNFSSPIVEARDDISALSEGFTRKVKLLRRLSTSFDEPSSCSFEGNAGSRITPVGSTANVQNEGFPSVGGLKSGLVDDSSEKKAKLNAWLTQLHEEALCRSQNNSDNSFSGGNFKGFSDDGDDSEPKSKPASPPAKITENLYDLLAKVIGFKGRNISHITVEQSVKDLCTVFMDATEEDKLKFFTILAETYGVDHEVVATTAANLASCKDADVRLTLEEKLRGALVPKSQWLFTQVGRLENGVKFLVDFRTDLLDAIEKAQDKASLKALNNSLRDLIGMWFNVGFLNLERVTWQSSCDMLQKISEYEAVHPMRNWTDLKKRVGPNRRCFVFTHNSMPGEPVVVLHTFLTDHIPSSVQKIVSNQKMRMMSLDSELPMTSNAEDPNAVSTAAFYSITSTQRGLTGIELGNYLIKRVVRELQSEFPKMTQYSSLSPIPGFKNWLVSSIKNVTKDPTQQLFTEHEINNLRPIFANYGEGKNFYDIFLDLLKVNSWFSDEKLVKELENPLMRLCAHYLYIVKRRGYALNPVAHFHLKNGAVLWRINWLGDTSPRGLGQSCGMMVNYRYFLDNCETNSQNYMENQVIQISDQVQHLVKLTPTSRL